MNNLENEPEAGADLEVLIRAYLDAFESRDVDRCLTFFADDAVIDFQSGKYRGPKAIAGWHRDRFGADLKVVRLESITVNDDVVVVDLVISSKRLAAWKIQSLSARITAQFQDGKIQQGKMAPRMMNPIDLIRSGQ